MNEETNYLSNIDDTGVDKARKPYETPVMEELGTVRTFVQMGGCTGSDAGMGACNGFI
jgi:hypothetical protein